MEHGFANGILIYKYDDETTTYYEYDVDGNVTFSEPYDEKQLAKLEQQILNDQILIAEENAKRQQEAILASIAATTVVPPDGQSWVQPTGPNDAYALNSTVIHISKTWVSLVDYNVWEPGVANWREEVTEGYAEWVQPTGSHDAYNIGDRVHHNSVDWESDVDANVWEPGIYGWTTLGLF